MTSLETPSITGFRDHVNVARKGGKSDFSSLEKTHSDCIISGETRKPFKSNAAVSTCPCCGAALQNRRPRVDLNANVFLFKGVQIHLSPTQAELMETLIRRAPGIVSHDTLIRHLWGQDEPADPRKNIQVHVCRLRVLLAPLGVSIVNVLDTGYRLYVEGEG